MVHLPPRLRARIAALVVLLQLVVALPAAAHDLPGQNHPTCFGMFATVWVDPVTSHIMRMNPDTSHQGTGETYTGTLNGTEGNDIVAGTAGNDCLLYTSDAADE